MFCEVVMIGAVIKTVWIFEVIVFAVELKMREFIIDAVSDRLKIAA